MFNIYKTQSVSLCIRYFPLSQVRQASSVLLHYLQDILKVGFLPGRLLEIRTHLHSSFCTVIDDIDGPNIFQGGLVGA